MGRPAKSPNKVTREKVQRALESGPLPADQLLALSRAASGMASRFQAKFTGADGEVEAYAKSRMNNEFKEWMRLAIEANKAAAPYFNYRLTTIKHEGLVPDLSGLTNDELDEVERTARLIAQHRRDRDGASPKVH